MKNKKNQQEEKRRKKRRDKEDSITEIKQKQESQRQVSLEWAYFHILKQTLL